LSVPSDFELIEVIIATSGGKAKHHNPTQKYEAAAAAHPMANQAIARIVRPKRTLTAARSLLGYAAPTAINLSP
jgi:hypothetical protein